MISEGWIAKRKYDRGLRAEESEKSPHLAEVINLIDQKVVQESEKYPNLEKLYYFLVNYVIQGKALLSLTAAFATLGFVGLSEISASGGLSIEVLQLLHNATLAAGTVGMGSAATGLLDIIAARVIRSLPETKFFSKHGAKASELMRTADRFPLLRSEDIAVPTALLGNEKRANPLKFFSVNLDTSVNVACDFPRGSQIEIGNFLSDATKKFLVAPPYWYDLETNQALELKHGQLVLRADRTCVIQSVGTQGKFTDTVLGEFQSHAGRLMFVQNQEMSERKLRVGRPVERQVTEVSKLPRDYGQYFAPDSAKEELYLNATVQQGIVWKGNLKLIPMKTFSYPGSAFSEFIVWNKDSATIGSTVLRRNATMEITWEDTNTGVNPPEVKFFAANTRVHSDRDTSGDKYSPRFRITHLGDRLLVLGTGTLLTLTSDSQVEHN